MKAIVAMALVSLVSGAAHAFPTSKMKAYFEKRVAMASQASQQRRQDPKCADFSGTWRGICTYDDGTKEAAFAKVEQQGCYSIKTTNEKGESQSFAGSGLAVATGAQLLASGEFSGMTYWSSDLQTYHVIYNIRAVSHIPGLFVADETANFEVSKQGADLVMTGRIPEMNKPAKEFVCKYAPQL